METSNNNSELINILELESNKGGNKVTCPKCNHNSVIKKSFEVDVPKAVGFVLFLGTSFAIVLMINVIIMVRQKIKINKLPEGIKEQVNSAKKYSILGLHIPSKTKISCSKCKYIFYENYDSGDLIIVVVFFLIILAIVGLIIFCFTKFNK